MFEARGFPDLRGKLLNRSGIKFHYGPSIIHLGKGGLWAHTVPQSSGKIVSQRFDNLF